MLGMPRPGAMRSSTSSRRGRSATRMWFSIAAPTAQVTALEDACWHRLLPLSMGRLEGDQVVCGYHGLVFNAAGTLHLHAGAEDHQSVRLRARLSDRRAPSTRLDLARRSRSGRSGQDSRFPLERRHRLGRRGRHLLQPEMRLPPRHRQPDGPDPRDLCPCRQHRRRGDHQLALRRDAYGAHGDRDALDEQYRAAAVLGQAARQARRACRPVADHLFPGAVDGGGRCGRRRDGNRRSRRETARRASTAPSSRRSRRRRTRPAIISGISCEPSGRTTSSSRATSTRPM